jgi:hypothetical protein
VLHAMRPLATAAAVAAVTALSPQAGQLKGF